MTLTTGGLLTGTILLIAYAMYWWHRERTASALYWFAAHASYGILAILATGSILGAAGAVALWGSNGLGDLTLVFGVGGDTHDLTRGATVAALNGGGRFAVACLTAALAGRLYFKRDGRLKIAAGVIVGLCFGLSATIAGAAAVPLASAVNTVGVAWTAIR